jgi:hypothetical protein
MEGSPDSQYRFRDALLPAAFAASVVLVGTVSSIGVGIMNQEQQAQQAERVVELLQVAHGPESVIVDQQAEAAHHRDNMAYGWKLLVGGVALDLVGSFGAAGVHVWLRRRKEADGYEA